MVLCPLEADECFVKGKRALHGHLSELISLVKSLYTEFHTELWELSETEIWVASSEGFGSSLSYGLYVLCILIQFSRHCLTNRILQKKNFFFSVHKTSLVRHGPTGTKCKDGTSLCLLYIHFHCSCSYKSFQFSFNAKLMHMQDVKKHFWKIKFKLTLFLLLLFIVPSLAVLKVNVRGIETERKRE